MIEEEPWLSREELVEREHQARLRDYADWPTRLEEICREAEADFQTAHPWLAPDMCVMVPVRRLDIADPHFPGHPMS
ncbi:MAG: hypothetical protein WCC08_10480 [Terrimicrobiaceae bacterium]